MSSVKDVPFPALMGGLGDDNGIPLSSLSAGLKGLIKALDEAVIGNVSSGTLAPTMARLESSLGGLGTFHLAGEWMFLCIIMVMFCLLFSLVLGSQILWWESHYIK